MADLRQVRDFLGRWEVLQLNPETMLLNSPSSQLLVKNHPLPPDEEFPEETLDQHLSLDPLYVSPLLHYEPVSLCDSTPGIRAIYQVDRVTLRD